MSNSFENLEAIDIRYSRTLGILFTASSTIVLFLSFYVFLLSGNVSVTLVSNVLTLAIGILYLTKTYFSVTSKSLYIYNLLGMTIKQYTFNSLEALTIENNKLYLQMHESRKKLPVAKWISNKDDWKILEGMINRQKQII